MGFFSWIKRNILPFVGGAIGTAIAPGIGTAIGAGLGKVAGVKTQGGDWRTALRRGATAGAIGYGAGMGYQGLSGILGQGARSGAGTVAGGSGLDAAAAGGYAGPGASAGLSPISVGPAAAGGAWGYGEGAPGTYSGLSSLGSAISSGFAGPGASAGISPASMGGGAGSWFSRLPTSVKWGAPILGGLGMDWWTKKKAAEREREGAQEYMDAVLGSGWTPAKRKEMMKGIAGYMGKQVGAARKRFASGMAAAGRGGGTFGKRLERVRRAGRETAATALAGTYGQTPVPSYAAYAARKKESPFWSDLLGLGGQIGTTYFGMKALKGLL